MTPPPILRRLADLRGLTRTWHDAHETIGVVPTMGALHDGHLSLVQAAKDRCDRLIVTIFVNPKQFNSPEDLANYPRTEQDDARKLARFGVDGLYVPDPDQVYPDGFATTVSVPRIAVSSVSSTSEILDCSMVSRGTDKGAARKSRIFRLMMPVVCC